jgi:hypothetical protein
LDVPFFFTLSLPQCGYVTGAHIILIPPCFCLDNCFTTALSDVNTFPPLPIIDVSDNLVKLFLGKRSERYFF